MTTGLGAGATGL